MAKNIKITKESETGLNKKFYDTIKKKDLTRGQFVDAIEKGNYPDYHVMNVKREGRNLKIPRSNPDGKTGNNLG